MRVIQFFFSRTARSFGAPTLFLLCWTLAFSTAQAQLINGSFELTPIPTDPATSHPQWELLPQTMVPGWQTDAPDGLIELWRSGFQGVPSLRGNQYLEVNATGAHSVYQDIPTVAGKTYRFGWAYRSRTMNDELQVLINGSLITTLGGNVDAWFYLKHPYVATSATTRLEFKPIGGGSYGNLLDAVSFDEDCCDELKTLPYPGDPARDVRTFQIFSNQQVVSVDIAFDPPPPQGWTGDGVFGDQGDGLVHYSHPSIFNSTYTRLPNDGSFVATRTVGRLTPVLQFNLGIERSQPYSGTVTLTVNHADLSVCVLRETWIENPAPLGNAGPWRVSLNQSESGPFQLDFRYDAESAMLGLTRNLGVELLDSDTRILAIQGPNPESAGRESFLAEGGELRRSYHTDREAFFEFADLGSARADMPLSIAIYEDGVKRVTRERPDASPRLRLTLYDDAGNAFHSWEPEIETVERVRYLPQIADGSGIRTATLLSNPLDVPIRGRIDFFDQSGRPWTLGLVDRSPASSVEFELPAQGSLRLQTDGSTQPAAAGYARITSDRQLGAVALFQLFDVAGGLITEAGVQQSTALGSFQVFAERGASLNTGLAIANPNSVSVEVSIHLISPDGLQGLWIVVVLLPGSQIAQYVDQLFEGEESLAEFDGTLIVESSLPVAATALRMQLRPTLTLSTLPVTPR